MSKIIFAAALAMGVAMGGAAAEAKHHHRHHHIHWHHHHGHRHHWRGVCAHEIFCTPMPCGDWYYRYQDQI